MDYIITYIYRDEATTKHILQFKAESDAEAFWKITENLNGIYPSAGEILLSQSSPNAWTPKSLKKAWTGEGMCENIGDIYIISLKNTTTETIIIDNIWPYRSDEVLDWPIKKQMPVAWEED